MAKEMTEGDRLKILRELEQAVQDRAAQSRVYRRAFGDLSGDIRYILAALERDPEIWRLNRAFHAVHVPSLTLAISMLDQVEDMQSVSEEDRHQILAALNQAAQLAKTARRKIQQTALSDTKLELDVLADYAPTPETPYAKPSRLTRTLDGVAAGSSTVWKGVKSTAGEISAKTSFATDRIGALPKLAGNLQRSLTGAVSDAVVKPLGMRVRAGTRALAHGTGAGVGLGVVIGVLCPPLLPLSAGGAVLAAMRTWRKDMAAAQSLAEEAREARIAQLQLERQAALRELAQGASALQMESEELSLMVDVETGEADAVILTGEHEGRFWSELSAAEKASLISILAESALTLVRILQE